MKTAKEIYDYTKKKGKGQMFSFHIDSVIDFMPFEIIRDDLKDGVTKEEWDAKTKPLTRENLIDAIKEYLPFALEKAEGQRGLSAARSIQKFQTLLFALGNEKLAEEIENYYDYGLPQLKMIQKEYCNEKS